MIRVIFDTQPKMVEEHTAADGLKANKRVNRNEICNTMVFHVALRTRRYRARVRHLSGGWTQNEARKKNDKQLADCIIQTRHN